jgi:hypothetical protein
MSEFFGKALTALPAYMSQALGLLSGPKAFVLARDLETPEAAADAYAFLGITLFLALIAQISFLPEQKDYLLTFASLAVQGAFGLILMSAALYLSWRIVGGVPSFKLLFIVSCYFSGISTLILVVFELLAGGWLKFYDPENVTQILRGAPPDNPMSVGYVGFALIFFVGFIAVYAWIFIVWGAYRKLTNVSRSRSAIALVVFTLLSPLLLAMQFFMQQNLMPAPERRGASAGRLPLELIGIWKSKSARASDSIPSAEATTYDFFTSGEYFRIHRSSVVQGGCVVTALENSLGRASVDGSMLVLAPQKHTMKMINECSKEQTETSLDLGKEIHAFEIRHQPTGWVLCLSGRYGQQCLTATAD